MNAVERLLWWLLGSSVGGYNRCRIIELLLKRPYNTNELSTILNLNYKTTRHHLEILQKNRIIIATGQGYGKVYSPSEFLENNVELFKEIFDKIGKK